MSEHDEAERRAAIQGMIDQGSSNAERAELNREYWIERRAFASKLRALIESGEEPNEVARIGRRVAQVPLGAERDLDAVGLSVGPPLASIWQHRRGRDHRAN